MRSGSLWSGCLTAGVVLVGTCTSANGASLYYQAFLDGVSEAPPNASPGTGFAQVDYDTLTHMMRVRVTFSGLLGTTTASHIHSATAAPGTGTAGVATQTPTFGGFPLGVSSGSYDHTFDMSLAASWNAPFITANGGTPLTAESAFLTSLAAGTAYVNVHSSVFPGGEIRGFLQVPSPSTLGLASFGGLLIARRRRR